MLWDSDDVRIAILARASAAFAEEIDWQRPEATLPWKLWPTVAAMIDHLGRNHLWAAGIVRTGGAVDRSTLPRAPAVGMRQWYESCRADLLSALTETAAEQQCWLPGGGIGITAFWRRRMVYETVKHLIDLRAAGGSTPRPAPELSPIDYADGIDELFAVFLTRSRTSLPALPGTLALEAIDTDRRWSITHDWEVHVNDSAVADARVRATAGDLALFVWERADPIRDPGQFLIGGLHAVIAAFATAPVHT